MKIFRLVHAEARRRAAECCQSAPDGYVVRISEPTRSLEQNAALWAMLADLAEQTDWHGNKLAPDEWKDLLSAGLVQSKVVPNLTGNGFVILGQRTSKLTKSQFSALLELIVAFGTERGVKWSQS
jgi:hypothetical protein